MKTLADFINKSKLVRGASKRTVDKFIKSFNIKNGDLIADIYGHYGY